MEKKIENLPYISKMAIANYFDKNSNTLKNSIAYWEKTDKIIRLKRGFYVFDEFLQKKDNIKYYPRFLATKMIEPSYLSMETVLQDYQMIADVVYNYSVVTTKKTNFIKNKFGEFNYQAIKKELFKGFVEQGYDDMKWFVATKAKALFDFIYFNQKKFQDISENELNGMRLNLEIMTEKDWYEYGQYTRNASKKMNNIYELMKKKYVS